jgi:hypothetical protein
MSFEIMKLKLQILITFEMLKNESHLKKIKFG